MKKQSSNGAPKVHCAHTQIIPIEKLKDNPANPNTHPPEQIALLAHIIEKQGWRNPIVVSKRSGLITKGHARLQAARALSLKTCPVDVQPYASEKQELADMVADNRIAELAEIDRSMMREVLEGLDDGSFDMDLTGFDEAALEELMTATAPESDVDAEPQIDKAEELRVKWGVERGQIWELGDHRLMCGDCISSNILDNLLDGVIPTSTITDPPYGMDLDTDWSGIRGTVPSLGFKKNIKGKSYQRVIGDDKPFDAAFLFDSWNAPEMFLFGADYYSDTIRNRSDGSWIVWDKRKESQSEGFGSEFELIWSKVKHKRRILRHEWFGFLREGEHGQARTHPTQKSVALMADIIQRWGGEVITDPFSGVATTLIACEQLKRKCRAMEIDPGYVAVSIQRWVDATGKTPKLITP